MVCNAVGMQLWAPAIALLVLVERAGPALEGAEMLLLSLFWFIFVSFCFV